MVPSILVGIGFVLAAIALVLGCYFGARQLLHGGDELDKTHDVAGTVAVRVAALHGLILALVYAQELDDYKGVRTVITQEAIAISDVYHDISRYGGSAAATIQPELARYLAIVVNEEWDMLGGKNGLSPAAWGVWDSLYGQILDLDPATDRQRYLANRMRNSITDVARLRQTREATGGLATLFWAPAVIGLALVAIPFYVYRPTRTHITLLSLYGAYAGVLLFFIFAFSNPFAEPGRLPPRAFEHLLAGDIGKSLPAAP
ncbi:DUF4239 domain-containing protein [Sinorhizobium sp. BG8]|uniref:bestrophin-like domain n=1 Tax=Sinorhizobium sp. BG8 TaxID=2613773 RepID=UPI00193DDBF1|nr:DUF4239 domain-containing protein [Sinorhizobium sp. BG8]QRM55273.1 DUF4239 domain-containing protein [Sinorhizobium sp. BG8]